MNNVDYDPGVSELINGIPTANNQDGFTLGIPEDFVFYYLYQVEKIIDEYGDC